MVDAEWLFSFRYFLNSSWAPRSEIVFIREPIILLTRPVVKKEKDIYTVSGMKKVLYLGAIVILLLIINGLAHSIYDLWSKKDLITQAQRRLDEEKIRNQKLKGELSYTQTKEFIESEARNKLFLAKPDEKEVIIPQIAQKEKPKTEVKKPNWQKWLDLFY